jgi:hypothetical protein
VKLIIAGSRTFNYYDLGQAYDVASLDAFLAIYHINPTEVVCGCGGVDEAEVKRKRKRSEFASDQGIDLLGELWADSRGVPINRVPAKWKLEGRSAGPKRNRRMAEYADALLLIWDGTSKGSLSMKTEMEKLGKSVYEIIIRSNE